MASRSEALIPQPEIGTSLGALGRAPKSQAWARVTATATRAFAVWVDGRDLGTRERAVYAARIEPDGGVLDPVGFRVAQYDWVHEVAIANDGTRVLVVFSAELGGISRIYAVRLDAVTGAFVDTNGPVTLATNPDDDRDPEVVFDGQNFVVAWVTHSQPARAQVRRVDPATGTALPGTLSLGTLDLNRVSIGTIGGGNSVVVFDQVDVDGGSSTELVSVQDGGASPFPSIPGPRARGGRIGPASATTYFVTWLDNSQGYPEILGARVSSMGFIDTTPLPIATGNDGGVIEREFADPVLTSGPSVVVPYLELTTTSGGSETFVRRVDPMTGAVQPQLTLSATRTELGAPFIAPLGGAFVGVYGRTFSPNSRANDDVFYTMGPAPGPLLSRSYQAQNNATGVAVGGNDLLAWTSYFPTDTDIAFTSWSPDAGLMTAEDTFVSVTSDQDFVDLSRADGRVLASFQRAGPSSIEGGRIDPQGVGVDNAPFTVCSLPGSRLVAKSAFDGTQWWTGWLDDRAARAAYVSRVTLGGSALDGSGRALPFTDPRSLAAASGPGQVLFASHSGTGVLQLARAFSDGGMDSDRIERTATFFARPAVDFDGVNYVVAVESDLPDGGEALLAARFDSSLNQLDLPAIRVREVPDVDGIAISFDGVHHIVVWSEGGGAIERMYGVRLTVDGQIVDAMPFDIAPAGRFTAPHVSGAGAGRSFVNFSRFDSPATETWRARAVILEQGGGGQSCMSDTDCGPNFTCVDGVCCNSACGGGVATDCVACSIANGGITDGTCTLVRSGMNCRSSVGECDVGEACDGVRAACPADQTRAGLTCSIGVCVGTMCEVDDGGLVFPDAGVPDGGAADAGIEPDGGSVDAGGGLPPERRLGVGCACAEIPGPELALFAVAFRAILNRRFRRRRATARDR
ncbi:MAG: hypothetical protein JNM17_08085 [Archangium sp.]|nr:hypothetical protein [Archangium sp.]